MHITIAGESFQCVEVAKNVDYGCIELTTFNLDFFNAWNQIVHSYPASVYKKDIRGVENGYHFTLKGAWPNIEAGLGYIKVFIVYDRFKLDDMVREPILTEAQKEFLEIKEEL